MAVLTFEQYALAGNSTFILQSHRTGRHLTFTVRKATERSEFTSRVWWVSGPNNELLGRIAAKDLKFFDSAKTDYSKAFSWAWRYRADTSAPLDFLPSAKCCRCGRRLTTPESIADGIGPECREALEKGS